MILSYIYKIMEKKSLSNNFFIFDLTNFLNYYKIVSHPNRIDGPIVDLAYQKR